MMTEIHGQDAALARLTRMKKSGKVPSALIFHGPDGVGKRLAARWFGAELNGGPNLAILEVDPEFQAALEAKEVEKQRTIHVETVRELTRRASLRADAGVWKVFIIDRAETFEIEAANALLKELEEPAPNTVWILITSRRERLLPTILSRCQTVAFKPLAEPLLRELGEREGIGKALLDRWAAAADGSLDRLKRLASYGELAGQGRSDPGAYWTVSQGLGRDLNQARETVDGVIDALLVESQNRESRIENRNKLLKLKRSLRSNVSPQLILQLAFLESE
jgi:DNA polymerase-3 subunit delta'